MRGRLTALIAEINTLKVCLINQTRPEIVVNLVCCHPIIIINFLSDVINEFWVTSLTWVASIVPISTARCSSVLRCNEIQYGGAIRLWNRAGRTVAESTLQYLRVFLSKPSASWLERGWYCKIIQCFCVNLCCLCYYKCIMVILWWKTWKDFRVTMSSSWHVYLCRVWRFSLRVRRCGARVCALAPLCACRGRGYARIQWWIAFPWMCR